MVAGSLGAAGRPMRRLVDDRGVRQSSERGVECVAVAVAKPEVGAEWRKGDSSEPRRRRRATGFTNDVLDGADNGLDFVARQEIVHSDDHDGGFRIDRAVVEARQPPKKVLGSVARRAQIENPLSGPKPGRPLLGERVADEDDVDARVRDRPDRRCVANPGTDRGGRCGRAGRRRAGRDFQPLQEEAPAPEAEPPPGCGGAKPTGRASGEGAPSRRRDRGRLSLAARLSTGAAPGCSRASQSATARAAPRRPLASRNSHT